MLLFICPYLYFQTPCCNKIYTCRFCHDENESHCVNRKDVTELVCTNCDTRQKVQAECENCSLRFGKVSQFCLKYVVLWFLDDFMCRLWGKEKILEFGFFHVWYCTNALCWFSTSIPVTLGTNFYGMFGWFIVPLNTSPCPVVYYTSSGCVIICIHKSCMGYIHSVVLMSVIYWGP